MDKGQFMLAFLGSAVVGALFSSLIVAFSQWRERAARRKEMLLTFSVELAKVYTARISSLEGKASLVEIAAIPRFHKMLKEIFETGDLSDENHKLVMTNLEALDERAAARMANIASALRESRDSRD
jgi:hypothetical protein